MRKSASIVVALTLFLVVATVAVASGPPPQPSFSTTGYTTNLVPTGDLTLPLIPTEFEPVPSGHVKFHISAQGGPQVQDDALCKSLYDELYFLEVGKPLPAENTCQALCKGFTGYACGTTGLFEDGSFIFEEWGLFYPPSTTTSQGNSVGANYGDLTVVSEQVSASFRFGGQAFQDPASSEQTVLGSFLSTDRSYRHGRYQGQGTYSGDAGYVFTVDYEFCDPWDGDGGDKDGRGSTDGGSSPCPLDRCAVFGSDLDLKNGKAVWRILNQGKDDLTISSITINWPAQNGQLTRIKLGGKNIYLQPQNPPYVIIDETDWIGNADDREIRAGKTKALRFDFEAKGISTQPSEYTVLVQFAQGCAVPFVAFPQAIPSGALP